MKNLSLALVFSAFTSTIATAANPIICTGLIGNDSYNVIVEIQSPTENSIIEIFKNNSLHLRIQGEETCGVMLVETQLVQDSPQTRPYKQTRIDALQKYNCSDIDALKMNIVGLTLNQRKSGINGQIGIQLKGERQATVLNLICQ